MGSQQSDTKDSCVSHLTRNSDKNSSIGKTSSVESTSNTELQMHSIADEERQAERENEELLDEATLEETQTSETENAGDLEASSEAVEPVTVCSNSLKTASKNTVTISEPTASLSSPSEEDVAEMPELLEKSVVEDEEEEDYVELKIEGSLTEVASLPTELQINSLSPAASEASEIPDAFSSNCKLIFQDEAPVMKKQIDTEIPDSKDSEFLTVAASESLVASEAALSQITVQPDHGQMLEDGKKTAGQARGTRSVNDCHDNASETPAVSEQKIVKLDVSSVTTDTEKLELKASTNMEPPQPLRPMPEVIMHVVFLMCKLH